MIIVIVILLIILLLVIVIVVLLVIVTVTVVSILILSLEGLSGEWKPRWQTYIICYMFIFHDICISCDIKVQCNVV